MAELAIEIDEAALALDRELFEVGLDEQLAALGDALEAAVSGRTRKVSYAPAEMAGFTTASFQPRRARSSASEAWLPGSTQWVSISGIPRASSSRR